MEPEQFDAVAERSQFADHLARSYLPRLFADGRPAFLATESVGDRTDSLGVAEARDEPAIHDREDGALRLHRGVRRLTRRICRLPLGQR
jgi:hypothetical protein